MVQSDLSVSAMPGKRLAKANTAAKGGRAVGGGAQNETNFLSVVFFVLARNRAKICRRLDKEK